MTALKPTDRQMISPRILSKKSLNCFKQSCAFLNNLQGLIICQNWGFKAGMCIASQKECKIIEGHLVSDHIHMLISIPPKYSVAQVVGFIKGKSAISIARTYMGRRKNFTGQHFWARGYHVSTVGRDEAMIRAYIKHQEDEDQKIDKLALF